MSNAATRIISFLVIAAFLAMGNNWVLAISVVLTTTLYILSPVDDLAKVIGSVLRLKWLFASILLIYLLLDQSSANFFFPFLTALKRIAILIIIILLISWILNRTPREKVLAALIYLLSPMKMLGVSTTTIALRIELIFRHIDSVSQIVSDNRPRLNQLASRQIGETVASLYQQIVDQSQEQSLTDIEIIPQEQIRSDQWIWPLSLFVVFSIIQVST